MLATLLLALAAPPNVVVILTDDQGWGDLSVHGNANLATPNIDAIAKGGATFDRFFVQPVCSPTRAEFLTGRYHPRGGVRNVTSGGERLNLDETTIADCFKAGGYRTGCFGKWHNGSQYPYHPNGRGFDEYYGFTSGHWGTYFDAPLERNGKDVKSSGYITDDLTTNAIDFIRANRDRPFFCYVAYNVPHSPMQVPDDDWKRFKDATFTMKGTGKDNLDHTRAAYAMCESLDRNIGRLTKALADRQLDRNTIVVYFHDNGPNGGRWNGGMKGRKGSTDDGGCRSPCFVKWPAKIAPGTTVKGVAGAIDLLPTLVELAGVKRVGEKPLDGWSKAKLLTGQATEDGPERFVVNFWNGKLSVRTILHRLDADGKLFDMIADPGQTKPIDDPATHKLLTALAGNYRTSVLADWAKADDRPIPVGHSAFPRTVLPARDGKPVGGVKRSANAPNCSFFTNWTKPDDAMTWSIEVAEAGEYDAEIVYTCPKADVGSTIRLSTGTAAWTGKITVAHDPPLTGMENDRVNRQGESYVKEFITMSLGRVDVAPGKSELRLAATTVPGKSVADVRAVVLTKVAKPQ
jgi:arylsulfatase A-like enzyme